MLTPLTPQARKLRQMETCCERMVWKYVRNRQIGGFKFRRQQPIGPFIVDFLCAEAKLILELEGKAHEGKEAHDESRARWLERRGYLVLRIPNDTAYNHLDRVFKQVLEECRTRSATLASAHQPRVQSGQPQGQPGHPHARSKHPPLTPLPQRGEGNRAAPLRHNSLSREGR